ncbi:MAG TPA: HAD-IIB family hydrolase, partial [Bacilli bacterium]|nr:HAD-IIB family hydrolase [Bacilli bacterium]
MTIDTRPQLSEIAKLKRAPGSFKLAAFDMDGTLLNAKHQLSHRSVTAVKTIAEQGIIVLVATGRMMSAVREHLDILGTKGIVVSHNGALVKDSETGQIYHHETVPRPLVMQLIDWAEEAEIILHLNFDDNICLTELNPYSNQFARDLGVELQVTDSLRDLPGEPTSVLL